MMAMAAQDPEETSKNWREILCQEDKVKNATAEEKISAYTLLIE